MVTILSWNLHKKKTDLKQKAISEFANGNFPNAENGIDIFVLQEGLGKYINTILDSQYDEIPYPAINGLDKRVRVFLKKGVFQYFATETSFNNKLVFVHLKTKMTNLEFNLCGVHLYSKAGNTERQQLWKNQPFTKKISELERTKSNNRNTIVVGDFNYNPYETDFSDPFVFNALDNRNLIAFFEKNKIGERNHDYWYNPMWNFLGDYDYINRVNRQASGTYFRFSKDETRYWHLFDGIILRPGMMDKINFTQCNILTETNSIQFLKPIILRDDESFIKEDLSDHLPIKFALNIN